MELEAPKHRAALVTEKGDLTEVHNYRGIALTSIVSKTLNRMILSRIKPAIEELLRMVSGRKDQPPVISLARGGY